MFSVRVKRTVDERVADKVKAWGRGKYHVDAINDETWRCEHPWPQRPTGDLDSRVDFAIQQIERQGRFGTLPLVSSSNEQTTKYLSELRKWSEGELERRAKSLRSADIRRSEEQAQMESDKALGVIDLATLRGRGPEFMLQFTAVVTIVCVVLALGLLGKLSPEQIGTILAAIAGYVLGQATSRREPSVRAARTVSSTDSDKSNLKD